MSDSMASDGSGCARLGATGRHVLTDSVAGMVDRHVSAFSTVIQVGSAAPPAGDPVVDAVRARLAARSAVGLAKYGCTVADNPLSRAQWLRHAQEEALDLAVYLERLIRLEEAPAARSFSPATQRALLDAVTAYDAAMTAAWGAPSLTASGFGSSPRCWPLAREALEKVAEEGL